MQSKSTVAVLPVDAARRAAEEVFQSARDARDMGEPDTAATLEGAADALLAAVARHSSSPTPREREALEEARRRLEIPAFAAASLSVSLHPVAIDGLLKARGWSQMLVAGDWCSPSGHRYAHRGAALAAALTAEAITADGMACAPLDPSVGERFRLLRDVDRFPHFVAPRGSCGTVTDVTDGNVSLRLDEVLDGAEEWNNEVVWTTDEPGAFGRDTEPEA